MNKPETKPTQEFRNLGNGFLCFVGAGTFFLVDAALKFGGGKGHHSIYIDITFFFLAALCLLPIYLDTGSKFIVSTELSWPGIWEFPIVGKDVAEMVRFETEGGSLIVFTLQTGEKLGGPDTHSHGDKVEIAIREWATLNQIPFHEMDNTAAI
jgi:hypothetical protein